MIRFVMALYILAANGFAVPDTVWTISWVMFGITVICAAVKAFDKFAK